MSSPVRLFIQKLFLASGEALRIALRHDICRGFKFGEVTASSESLAESLRVGVVERHVLCA